MVSHELDIARPLATREVRVVGGLIEPVTASARSRLGQRIKPAGVGLARCRVGAHA
jgi:hypothetical protein